MEITIREYAKLTLPEGVQLESRIRVVQKNIKQNRNDLLKGVASVRRVGRDHLITLTEPIGEQPKTH